MKKIYFMRHAKAQKDLEQGSDFLRKITKQGEQELELIFERLKRYAIKPDLFLCSSAIRTMQSAKQMARFYNFDTNTIIFLESLYHASAMQIYDMIKQLDSYGDNRILHEVFIVGHNPSLKQVCAMLSNTEIYSLPTSSVICLECNIEKFCDLEKNAKIAFFEYIKPLKQKAK